MGRSGDGWRGKFSKYIVREEKDGETRAYCPLHEDPTSSKTPSASFNFATGKFMCFSRCGGYAISQVWDLIRNGQQPARKVNPDEPVDELAAKRARRDRNKMKAEGGEPLPTEERVAEWAARLQSKGDLLQDILVKRGLQRSTLAKFQIGWDGDRIMIPVRDEAGALVNVRRYGMNLKANKMLNWPGYGDAVLWGQDALKQKRVILFEGEMDAVLARQYRFPSLTATAGAGTWFPEWDGLFAGKLVYLCYDVDDAGENGARKVANSIRRAAEAVFIIKLPLNTKGSDFTDYIVTGGGGRNTFVDLMKATPPYRERKLTRETAVMGEDIPDVRMRNSFDPALADKPINMVATISGRSATPTLLPRSFELNCGQDWQKTKCANCPMENLWGGQHKHQIPADDRLVLKMIDLADDKQRFEYLKALEVPGTCPKVEVTMHDQWRVDQLAVMPNIDDPDEGEGEQMLRQVFNVTEQGKLTPTNTTARLTGFSTSSPKNSQMVFHSWSAEETKTSLDRFEMTEELLGALETVFQPGQGQKPVDKLRELARDLAANVTHIYGRDELHIGYDLVWHSVLDFSFRGSRIGKGWLELLVMGDTRTGKSEAAERLRRHYQSGVLKSCEGATLAGLVGGAQQIGNSWVITWGTIPLQDRRLVILDEVSGISDKNIIEQMSAVRSSGRAQVTKVVSQETFARTRTIWISNPPDGRAIRETNNGAIDAIQKLIVNPEDVARFDFAMVAAQDDVDSSIINASNPPRARHLATQALSSALVTWAWSRTHEQVIWSRGTERHVLACAEEVGGRYIASPPLIQPENVRVKLARLAVAVAARLFSHDGTGEKVLVCNEHVDAAVAILDELYGKRWFGYGDHSRKEIRAQKAAELNAGECREFLLLHEGVRDTLETAINDSQFRARDFEEFGGMMKEEASQAIGQLLRMGMVRRKTKGYIAMTPPLIGIVRDLQED